MTGKALRPSRSIDLSGSIRSMAQQAETQPGKLYPLADHSSSNVFRFTYSHEVESALGRHVGDLHAGRPVPTSPHSVHIFDLDDIYKGMLLAGRSASQLGRRRSMRSRRQSRQFSSRETPLLPAFSTELFNTPSPQQDHPDSLTPADRKRSLARLPSLSEIKKDVQTKKQLAAR